MIRQALPIDFDDIVQIKKQLALDITRLGDTAYKKEIVQRGFLLPSIYTHEDFMRDLCKVYLVVEIDEKVVGFLRVDEKQDYSQQTPLIWLEPTFKDTYFSMPHAVIGGIGVLPEYTKHGFATQLFLETIKELTTKNIRSIFSLVTTSPVCNTPSLKFHEKNGFEKIAEREKGDTFDLHDYQSVLLVNMF